MLQAGGTLNSKVSGQSHRVISAIFILCDFAHNVCVLVFVFMCIAKIVFQTLFSQMPVHGFLQIQSKIEKKEYLFAAVNDTTSTYFSEYRNVIR